MSLPTGRQLLLFAFLQLVVLWGLALLLARSVTPVGADVVHGAAPVSHLERATAGAPSRDTSPVDASAQMADFGLSPAFWQRAAGALELRRRVARGDSVRARVYWIPGPTGTIPVPLLEKVCRPKREAARPRS